MLNTAKLRAVSTIVTHAGCPDGVASAMILNDALPGARVVFLRHGSPEMDALTAEPGLLFCDIAPPAARVAEFVAAGAMVLDHHKTARAVVHAFGDNGVFGNEVTEPGVCGAVLAFWNVWRRVQTPAWREAHGDIVERFATLAGIRDTWQRDDLRWDEACAQAEALRFYPAGRLLARGPAGWDDMLAIGPLLLEKQAQAVAGLIRDALRVTIEGKRVVIVASAETSDVMEALKDEADIVAGFAYRCDNGAPRMAVSLRGRGVDVAAIAKQFGGGGHTAAAGFTANVGQTSPNPYAAIEALLWGALRPFQ